MSLQQRSIIHMVVVIGDNHNSNISSTLLYLCDSSNKIIRKTTIILLRMWRRSHRMINIIIIPIHLHHSIIIIILILPIHSIIHHISRGTTTTQGLNLLTEITTYVVVRVIMEWIITREAVVL
jgi:hypothetical protein